jgi:hypothetical protein
VNANGFKEHFEDIKNNSKDINNLKRKDPQTILLLEC